MKAISLTQPWATLIACGAKKWETRSWSLRLPKGTIVAIHASKGYPAWAQDCVREWPFNIALPQARNAGYCESDGSLPLGKVIAIARFDRCVPTAELARYVEVLGEEEESLGNFVPGRYGFCFSSVAPIVPIPARGALGIWEFTPPPEGFHDANVKGALEWFTDEVNA